MTVGTTKPGASPTTSPRTAPKTSVSLQPDKMGVDPKSIARGTLQHLQYTLAELPKHVDSEWEPYVALALAVRDRMIERWIKTQDAYYDNDAKRVYYMSLEFLMGRTLMNSVCNLGLRDATAQGLMELGYKLEELAEAEWDAGLGNGGLGRLAACFLDSMATMALPSYGYGIRYDYGIFHQRIVNGAQVELPDAWLRYGNPWEIPRSGDKFRIQWRGRVHTYTNADGRLVNEWVDTTDVLATPYDTPIPGYGCQTVNTLRLWSAKAVNEFDFGEFNEGDYVGAVEIRARSESVSRVLYPNDNSESGKQLRLGQEYFFTSATLQDIIRRYKKRYEMFDRAKGLKTFDRFAEKVAIQLNDTHPALAIAELMRLLVDIEGLGWDEAWDITTKTFGYTNHTVMPEALERWSMGLFAHVLPRHLQIIFEINQRFLEQVRKKYPNDGDRANRMSIIEEGPEKRVRMATLAIVGSHSVNGVAALHSDILKKELFRDFYELWPEKFNNKTNGITQRRWLLMSNPGLAEIITRSIGDGWVTNLNELRKLEPLADNPAFGEGWREAKRANKLKLAEIIRRQYAKRGDELRVDPDSIFDCQVKRIHEYKRQLLNVLHVITLYNRIKDKPSGNYVPRTMIFGGKAAPGYHTAKLIIRLINAVADVVNHDAQVSPHLKVAFIADYRVSLAERIFPASDLSEQISTAGTEASGTGNMKFALNGALTIGTMDGANIEIAEEVGKDNIFIFGLLADEVSEVHRRGYNPWEYYHGNAELKRALDQINGGHFSPNDRGLFQPIYNSLLHGGDKYLLLADYASYIKCQEAVSKMYRDPAAWTKKSILNVARMGKFSSDRTIQQYSDDIWNVKPVKL
jgi:glycogen phosphorylase